MKLTARLIIYGIRRLDLLKMVDVLVDMLVDLVDVVHRKIESSILHLELSRMMSC